MRLCLYRATDLTTSRWHWRKSDSKSAEGRKTCTHGTVAAWKRKIPNYAKLDVTTYLYLLRLTREMLLLDYYSKTFTKPQSFFCLHFTSLAARESQLSNNNSITELFQTIACSHWDTVLSVCIFIAAFRLSFNHLIHLLNRLLYIIFCASDQAPRPHFVGGAL